MPVKSDESTSWWRNPYVMVPAIAAILAAIIGGITTAVLQTGGGSGGASSPTRTPTVSSPTASATPAPTTSATATPAASGIYHQGRLELASGTCADLDAPPSDSQWGELSANPDAGGGDLCSQYPSFVGVNGATLVTVNSGTDTTCQNATGWLAANYYKDLNLSVGSFVCVHTNQGRYSLLRVAAINSADNSIVFSVKTFKKPGD
jgi:hypothetical protein